MKNWTESGLWLFGKAILFACVLLGAGRFCCGAAWIINFFQFFTVISNISVLLMFKAIEGAVSSVKSWLGTHLSSLLVSVQILGIGVANQMWKLQPAKTAETFDMTDIYVVWIWSWCDQSVVLIPEWTKGWTRAFTCYYQCSERNHLRQYVPSCLNKYILWCPFMLIQRRSVVLSAWQTAAI